MSFEEIVDAVSGKVVLKGKYDGFNKVSTDTRKIEKGDIFVALKGERFNGNKYIVEASKKGASICIIDEIKYNDEEIEESTTIIKVENTGEALLDLAEFYKSKLKVKVVAITGSAGKTSTKDLVAAALSAKFKVFKTEGNFNNQIGLPLMVFKLNNSYDIAVLEMGMNNLNEIHTMAKAARPDIALITNVGSAHIGNLGSRENILRAKLEITDFFSKENTLIINGDNDLLAQVKSESFKIKKTGIENDGEFLAYDIILGEDHVDFAILENGKKTEERIFVKVPGKHTVSNSLLAIAAGRLLNMTYDELRRGFKNLQTTAMRMEIIKGKKFNIINDCYNANPDSMMAAIDVLKNFKSNRRVAILGTMGELGDESFEAHKKVGAYVAEKDIDLLIALGEYKDAFREGFESVNIDTGQFADFEEYDEAVKFLLKKYIQKEDSILIKASRAMKLEAIVEELKKSNS